MAFQPLIELFNPFIKSELKVKSIVNKIKLFCIVPDRSVIQTTQEVAVVEPPIQNLLSPGPSIPFSW